MTDGMLLELVKSGGISGTRGGYASCRQCNDGIDNDSDGKADYWPDGNGDPECTGKNDNGEATAGTQ